MKKFLTLNLTEQQKAIMEGFIAQFTFSDGLLFCIQDKKKGYSISSCTVYPRPCLPTRTIVYRIITPCGIKGHTILDFEQDEESIHN